MVSFKIVHVDCPCCGRWDEGFEIHDIPAHEGATETYDVTLFACGRWIKYVVGPSEDVEDEDYPHTMGW